MKHLLAPVLGLTFASSPLLAVYAPIPEHEQGKALSFHVGSGVYYDDNIFGSPAAEIDSWVYRAFGGVSFNASVTDQTFFTASYRAQLDYVEDRPDDQTLDSHFLTARLAHSFSPETAMEISNTFSIVSNPESTVAGVPINTDQSYKRNQFDVRFNTALGPRTGVTLTARNIWLDYDNATLAAALDRYETLLGIAGSYALRPDTKLVTEYRFQDIAYDTGGNVKDKQSHFVMAGADYQPGRKLSTSVRLGAEFRERDGDDNTTSPYVEVTGRYTYGRRSLVSGGYVFSLDETSDSFTFNDREVHRVFASVQHGFTAQLIGSASVSYEIATLNANPPASDVDEDTVRAGLALTWLARKNWSVSGTLDHDRTDSDDPSRELERTRVGVNARYQF